MKAELFSSGIALLRKFCSENNLTEPAIEQRAKETWPFRHCAYYRPTKIVICLSACGHIGTGGRAWSYPGYTVDRTPYGVLQHELGHHVDVIHSKHFDRYQGDFSQSMRSQTGEKPLTGYCPDDGEWFAEMFRLFVTNPDLLRLLKPRTFNALTAKFKPVVAETWDAVLKNAPQRTLDVCSRKIAEALIS